MSGITCRQCATRNTQSGSCIKCGSSLGSPVKALWAALVSSTLLGLMWAVSCLAFDFQVPYVALVFGGLVSGSVDAFSRGRGLYYQAVASTATVAGMFFSDTYVVWRLTVREGLEPPGAAELWLWALENDGITLALCVLGLMGGFWLWRQPGESE